MFTRCPQCKTVHPLNAGLLSDARGLVECGQCGRTFSALNFLFDQWPDGEEQRPASGSEAALPVLVSEGTTETDAEVPQSENDKPENRKDGEQQAAPGPDTASPVIEADGKTGKEENTASSSTSESENSKPEGNKADSSESKQERLVWSLATALLVLLTITHSIWTFREPLLDNSGISSWMKKAGWLQVEQQGLLKDPQQIQLVSRDMHTHPTRSGILVLSLTFVNLASRNQVFPELEVTLMDAAGQPVAQRRLQPVEYLRSGADTEPGLAADVYLPVLLEFGDPGEQAVGFEIQFL